MYRNVYDVTTYLLFLQIHNSAQKNQQLKGYLFTFSWILSIQVFYVYKYLNKKNPFIGLDIADSLDQWNMK